MRRGAPAAYRVPSLPLICIEVSRNPSRGSERSSRPLSPGSCLTQLLSWVQTASERGHLNAEQIPATQTTKEAVVIIASLLLPGSLAPVLDPVTFTIESLRTEAQNSSTPHACSGLICRVPLPPLCHFLIPLSRQSAIGQGSAQQPVVSLPHALAGTSHRMNELAQWGRSVRKGGRPDSAHVSHRIHRSDCRPVHRTGGETGPEAQDVPAPRHRLSPCASQPQAPPPAISRAGCASCLCCNKRDVSGGRHPKPGAAFGLQCHSQTDQGCAVPTAPAPSS